jgi:hypothetical protein
MRKIGKEKYVHIKNKNLDQRTKKKQANKKEEEISVKKKL